MKMNKENLFTIASEYLANGLSVIPVGRDKKPLIQWKPYQDRLASEDEVKNWIHNFTDMNIAIVTGEISGLVVVDIEKGGDTTKFPPTLMTKTGGGGWHFFYKHPGGNIKNDVRIFDKVDIRGDGGYVVAPPSQHLSGNLYEWIVPFHRDELNDFPIWLSEKLENKQSKKTDWSTFFATTQTEGTRHLSATQYAGKLLYHLPPELWEQAGWSALQDWNKNNAKPSLSDEELMSIWSGLSKKEIGKREVIDPSEFKEMSLENLIRILDLTIKHDEESKVAIFMCALSAYTEDSQFNVALSAPSSTGKSYIPLEICNLFPKEDLMILAHCSPTAFFHDSGVFDKELKGIKIDLSRRIIIFLDQANSQLLERMRPLLSHDQKVLPLKITDKNEKHGMRTKNAYLIGYPSVVFCSASLKYDEQESTRFLMLSPQTSNEKLRAAISERIMKDSNTIEYKKKIENNLNRQLLMRRIRGIRAANVKDVIVENTTCISELFLKSDSLLKPRYQRDVSRVIAFVKSFALLNVWFRNKVGDSIVASQQDIDDAIQLWNKLSKSQEYNISPYIYSIYVEVIYPLWLKKNEDLTKYRIGLTRREILKEYLDKYGRPLTETRFRQEIIPMLEVAGLILQENDLNNGRQKLIHPVVNINDQKKNSEFKGGVIDS